MPTRKDPGIVLYDIQENGCLNGVYTNIDCQGRICNEIARKRDGTTTIDGVYDNVYFEPGQPCITGTLTVTKQNPNIYNFRWTRDKSNHVFEGTGFKMNHHQLAVVYYEP